MVLVTWVGKGICVDQSWDSVLVTDVLHVCSPQPGYKAALSSGFSASTTLGGVPRLCLCPCIIYSMKTYT